MRSPPSPTTATMTLLLRCAALCCDDDYHKEEDDNKVESRTEFSLICWCGNGNYTFINRCLRAKLTILMTLHFNACGAMDLYAPRLISAKKPSDFGVYSFFWSALRISKAIIIVNEWYCILMRKKATKTYMTNEQHNREENNENIHSTNWKVLS